MSTTTNSRADQSDAEYRAKHGCGYCRQPVAPGQNFCWACLDYDSTEAGQFIEPSFREHTNWGSRGDHNFINPGKAVA